MIEQKMRRAGSAAGTAGPPRPQIGLSSWSSEGPVLGCVRPGAPLRPWETALGLKILTLPFWLWAPDTSEPPGG